MSKPAPPHGYAPDGMPIWTLGADGKARCGRRRKNGEPCQAAGLDRTTGRCHAPGHGGGRSGRAGRPRAIKPTAELSKSGRRYRNKMLRGLGIARRVEEVLADPAILEHRHNIALLDGLMQLEGEGYVSPRALWESAAALLDQLFRSPDVARIHELRAVVDQGLDATGRLDKIVALAEAQRKHIDSEIRRETQMQDSMTARQVLSILSEILFLAKEVERDTTIPRDRFSIELGRAFERSLSGGIGTGTPGAGGVYN